MQSESSAQIWRNRDFVFLWGGQALSLLGTQISTFALPLLVLALTNSPVQAGFISTVQRLPFLLLSLPVGAVIDRWNRKQIMLLADAARFLLYGSLPLAYLLAVVTIVHLYLIALIGGIALVFFDIANTAAFPRVVSASHLSTASAVMEGTSASADLLGPGIGGFLLGLAPTIPAGGAFAYLADSLSYLVSVLGLATIRTPFQVERQNQEKKLSIFRDAAAGLRFLWTHKQLRPLALLGMSCNVFIGASMLAIIVLARNELHLAAFMIGLILTVGGVGAIAGAIVVPWLQRRISVSRILVAMLLLWIGSAALLALAFSPAVAMIGWTLFTLANPIYFSVSFVYRVGLVPDELQGRVNSIYRTMLQAGLAFGSGLGGLVLGLLNAHQTFWLLALGLLLSLNLILWTELRHAQ